MHYRFLNTKRAYLTPRGARQTLSQHSVTSEYGTQSIPAAESPRSIEESTI